MQGSKLNPFHCFPANAAAAAELVLAQHALSPLLLLLL
jgi:hypothetical protein